jgi:hypothetical protein
VFIYSLLPLLLAGLLVRVDRRIRGRVRRLETFLIYLLGLGVVGSGIGGFAGHLFLSDLVAESIGWEAGSPFQLEMGFANLALAVLGIVAIGRRDGFREATVTAATVVGVGATIVHVVDILQTGNLAPGNTVQIVSNLLRPALLIAFLSAIRRAERDAPPQDTAQDFDRWRARHAQAAGWMAAIVATGFAVGYGVDRPVLLTLAGVLVGALAVTLTLLRPARGA